MLSYDNQQTAASTLLVFSHHVPNSYCFYFQKYPFISSNPMPTFSILVFIFDKFLPLTIYRFKFHNVKLFVHVHLLGNWLVLSNSCYYIDYPIFRIFEMAVLEANLLNLNSVLSSDFGLTGSNPCW